VEVYPDRLKQKANASSRGYNYERGRDKRTDSQLPWGNDKHGNATDGGADRQEENISGRKGKDQV